MPLVITLRRGPDSSPFRRQLLRLCRMPAGGDLILCSGYIQQQNDGFYNLLGDELLTAIANGTKGYRVQTIAGKLQKSGVMDWPKYYRDFVGGLRAAGVTVDAFVAPKRNWHAKIAVRMDGRGQPIAAIVGSSNLTAPAYAEGPRRRTWNYESDVTIWLPDPGLDSYFRPDTEANADRFEEMLVELSTSIRQPGEAERIKTLLRDIEQDRETLVALDDYLG